MLRIVLFLSLSSGAWGFAAPHGGVALRPATPASLACSAKHEGCARFAKAAPSMSMEAPEGRATAGLPRAFVMGIFAPLLAGALLTGAPALDVSAADVLPDLSQTPLGPSGKSSAKIVVEGVPRVVDGDTLVIQDANGNKERIRLLGIDAPESKQTCKGKKGEEYMCGIESQQALQKLVGNDRVKCIANKRDMYNRVLGVCYDERTGVELNREMINEGEAIAYTAYSKAYVPVEDVAKQQQAGVWRGEFQEPWEYRKAKRIASRQAAEARDFVRDAKKKAKEANAAQAVASSADDNDAPLEE